MGRPFGHSGIAKRDLWLSSLCFLLRVDAAEGFEIFEAAAAENAVVVKFPLAHFALCYTQSTLDFVFMIGAAVPQSAFEFMDGGRHDEDGDDFSVQKRVFAPGVPECGCALHINVEDQVVAGGELVVDFALECAVAVAVDMGPFVEFARVDLGIKGGRVEKIIIDPVMLAFAGRACGRGDDPLYLGFLGEHTLADSGFSASGWPGDDEEETAVLGVRHQ